MPTHYRMSGNAEQSEVKYKRMKSPKSDEGYTDLQFKKRPPKVPWRSIAVAVVLFVLGSALLTVGALLLSGYIPTEYNDRFWPIVILGVILFVPGAYHVRLAIYAYRGYTGYSFDDIPDYDD